MAIEWRDILGYEGFYSASSDGQIRRIGSHKSLRPQNLKGGYLLVCLCKYGVRKSYTVHGLIARAFLGNPPNGYEVNHKDGNKKNNALRNLEYLTRSENDLHAVRLGRWVDNRGAKCGTSKLKEKEVVLIRTSYALGEKSISRLALDFKVHRRTVFDIVKRRSWTNIL